MNDPYVVLGISRDATDDEVKTAYRALAKKYHPDNFASSPELAEVANEKMREVNEAYDAVVRERKNGGSSSSSHSSYSSTSSSSQSHSSYSSASSSSSGAGGNPFGGAGAGAKTGSRPRYTNQYSTTTDFPDVRRLIMNNRFDDANAVLDGVTPDKRNAEWNFLKGAVLYRRGWLEQANVHLTQAVNMEPDNAEFRAAYNQCTNMRSGGSGGYRLGKDGSGCSPCSACCSLLCADQCCECMGGDLISCC